VLILGYIVTAVVSYFLGSLPAGFLVARAKGVDIRTVGSGNIGATNVFRTVGKLAGIFVFLVDAAKGYVACAIVGSLSAGWFAGSASSAAREFYPILGGVVAVLGHNYTCWLGFKGGKGIATSAGVLMGLFPGALLVVLGIWILVFALSRYVSLASIVGAFWLPLFVWMFDYSRQCVIVAVVLAVLAILKHKSNIQRLIAGTEHRFGGKKASTADVLPPLP
jgi:glycerol-3-phosphate acyltransferase PlsY